MGRRSGGGGVDDDDGLAGFSLGCWDARWREQVDIELEKVNKRGGLG